MSKYLGKIHYWLFNKIKYSEELENKIEKFAFEEGLLEAAHWKSDIISKFGPTTGQEPLEAIINESNIHGWLQDKICRTESRMASWITNILSVKIEYKKNLEQIFREDGEEKGKKANEIYQLSSANQAYRVINDFILEGMPCDAVDRVIEDGEDRIAWISTQCIHSDNWKIVGGNVQHFYDLRQAWLESFLSVLGDGYNFSVQYMDGTRLNTITLKKTA
ncbi:MAG: hypothetical protein GX895_04575 [Clostridiales bacterium]|uniref:hypothetical protein n=1 Tax=Clostridium sp. N3C TaxID=1776758 RepID=UPI00092DEDAB|nr:hypothetical protein [Clostridium sp. N3C]NLZ48055.1 hypothetical protein [Clostridiales bacterium]SCN22210.1 hypothetical protein N3C_0644 [Clostridium sp. N3C]